MVLSLTLVKPQTLRSRVEDQLQMKLSAGVLEAKAEFYRIMFEGSGNALVSEILGGLPAHVSLLRATSMMLPDRLPCSLDEIDALLACIQRRDARGAQKVSRQHVFNAERAALGVFKQADPVRAVPSPTIPPHTGAPP